MSGVAGPMLGRSKAQGARFLLGLLAGEIAASGVVGTVVYLAGFSASYVLPSQGRQAVAGVVALLVGIADVRNRTPHVWRQVPQRLLRIVPPGQLGLVWGFDLALLVTTQKSTSLIWAAVAGVLFIFPSYAWITLIGMAILSVASISARSMLWGLIKPNISGDRRRPWFAPVRRLAGVVMIIGGIVTVASAFHMAMR